MCWVYYYYVCILVTHAGTQRWFDHFTKDQKSLIKNATSKSADYLNESNHGNNLGIGGLLFNVMFTSNFHQISL